MEFTREQNLAINTSDCNILVAAGAGSRENICFSSKNNSQNNR